MEFKHLTASQFLSRRAFEGYSPEDLGMDKTTKFKASGVGALPRCTSLPTLLATCTEE